MKQHNEITKIKITIIKMLIFDTIFIAYNDANIHCNSKL